MPPENQQGASALSILHEPDWTQTHSHRVGTRGRDARFMGITHSGDETTQKDLEEVAEETLNELREKVIKGELVTVRDIMEKQVVCSLFDSSPNKREIQRDGTRSLGKWRLD